MIKKKGTYRGLCEGQVGDTGDVDHAWSGPAWSQRLPHPLVWQCVLLAIVHSRRRSPPPRQVPAVPELTLSTTTTIIKSSVQLTPK